MIDPPDEFFDLALECTNGQLMRVLDVDRATVRQWRKVTKLHRPRGQCKLPAPGGYDESMSLTELARAYGWGSVKRFSEALRKFRPAIHAKAKANGLAKRSEHAKAMGVLNAKKVRVRGMSGRFARAAD